MNAPTDYPLRRAWKLPAAMWALSTVGFFAVYISAVLTQEGQFVENSALDASSYANQQRALLNLVTIPNLLLATIVLAVLGAAFRGVRSGLRVLAMIVAANVLTQLLKYAVLSRPDFVEAASDNTFPSGHTVVFASVLLGLLMVLPAAVRPFTGILVAAVLGTVAFQLLEFGWHRASDVVGGVLLVVAMVALAHLLLPDRRPGGILVRRGFGAGSTARIAERMGRAGAAHGSTALGSTTHGSTAHGSAAHGSSGREGRATYRPNAFNRALVWGLLGVAALTIVGGAGFAALLAVNQDLASTHNLLLATQIICVAATTSAVLTTLALQRTRLA
ncbi:phosphatase PAP2 family protein [Glaciihabitans tibetensis]|nr:phosphatase PAP2 family protein [Glaciihabitans tibetensis]